MNKPAEKDWYISDHIEGLGFCDIYPCPICGRSAYEQHETKNEIKIGSTEYQIMIVRCAACHGQSVWVAKAIRNRISSELDLKWVRRVEPAEGRRIKKFPHTDARFIKSYEAACRTMDVSPEASATMARRCLEMLLIERGYKQKRLVQKIEALLNEPDPKKHLPQDIHDCVDVVRNFGNFGAHPMTDAATLQIVDVEEGEAEWCIEIVEQLFSHYYERLAKLAEKIAAANLKLISSGKPPIKS